MVTGVFPNKITNFSSIEYFEVVDHTEVCQMFTTGVNIFILYISMYKGTAVSLKSIIYG